MQLLVNLSVLGYVVVVTLVGARMLLLARRTRGLPELLIGAGSVLICGVGFPISVASGFGGALAQVNAPLWIASEFLTQLGVVLGLAASIAIYLVFLPPAWYRVWLNEPVRA